MTFGLLIGAAAAASVITTLRVVVGRPPRLAVAVLLLIAAAMVTGLLPERFRGSRWRVPRSWGQLPGLVYPVLFGVALGFGFATAAPSPAFFGWAVASIGLGSWRQAALVFAAFAAMRSFSILAVAILFRRGRDGHAALEHLSSVSSRAAWVEAALLVVVAAVYLQ